MIREGSKSIPTQGVKVKTRTFKISNKVETNSKDRDIVYKKYQGLWRKGVITISKTLRRLISN